jgi:LCP family protein required for cell wall assembly
MLDDIPRPGIWKRLLVAALLVIFASAGATTVAAFHELDKVVEALELGPELKLGARDLAETDPGEPQTLMILGSDRRPRGNGEGAGTDARSDTIMLVRLDGDKEATAIMSLPRDLKVEIPGYGTDKINAAYTVGGPALTLKTVKRLTGLQINHVINVSFRGFGRAVNAMGCVYADIDRRYYNDSFEFSFIDVPPGYQRMCGKKALQYVRYRHTDTDIVRSARQQDFLRQTKQQITTGELYEQRDRLLRIFGRNTTTDAKLRSRSEVLRLLKLALGTADQPIKEIHFEGSLGPSYVEASNSQLQKLVQQFLQVEDTPGPRGRPESSGRRERPRRRKRLKPDALGLYDASGLGKDMAVQAVERGAGGKLPVLYPTQLLAGSEFDESPRVYRIKDTEGKKQRAYRMVVQVTSDLGEYYGLQGTTWQDAPILSGATETRKIGRREYELHFAGDRLRLVAWRTPRAVYWVSNTLLQSLSEAQMLAIARAVRRL